MERRHKVSGHCTEEGHCLTNLTIQNSQECNQTEPRLEIYILSIIIIRSISARNNIFNLTQPAREVIPDNHYDHDDDDDGVDDVVAEEHDQGERSDATMEEIISNTCRSKYLLKNVPSMFQLSEDFTIPSCTFDCQIFVTTASIFLR